MDSELTLRVDGTTHHLTVDTRTSLLDALRRHLGETSPKKGCDHGQCGACTVLVDGRRVLSCLTLAVTRDGAEVTTAAGLTDAEGREHPLHAAFVEHDGFQCGFCTPGHLCSAAGMLAEAAADGVELDDAEIAERMSGNLCRCGAHLGIRAAIASVADRREARA